MVGTGTLVVEQAERARCSRLGCDRPAEPGTQSPSESASLGMQGRGQTQLRQRRSCEDKPTLLTNLYEPVRGSRSSPKSVHDSLSFVSETSLLAY